MRDWGLWEWAAYGTLALSIVGDAVEQARRRWQGIDSSLPEFFSSPIWAFLPLTFLILGTGIFLANEAGWLGLQKNDQIAMPKTALRLSYVENVMYPEQVARENIADFFSLNIGFPDPGNPYSNQKAVVLFIVYTHPVNEKQNMKISFINGAPVPYELTSLSFRYAVISFHGSLAGRTIDISQ